MTHDDFAARIIAMQGTLYRVTCTILRNHADREDAVQSAIEKAWRKRDSLKDDNRLTPWMVRILIRECYTILRRQKREMPVETLPDSPAPEGVHLDLYRFFTSLPDTLRLHMFLSVAVSVLFFASLVFFLRVALRNCYVPMVGVLLTFTLFYERSRSLRMRGLGALRGALFDPYISSYILGDALPQQYGFGSLWSANRLLFFDLSLVLLFAAALILRHEKMHE